MGWRVRWGWCGPSGGQGGGGHLKYLADIHVKNEATPVITINDWRAGVGECTSLRRLEKTAS